MQLSPTNPSNMARWREIPGLENLADNRVWSIGGALECQLGATIREKRARELRVRLDLRHSPRLFFYKNSFALVLSLLIVNFIHKGNLNVRNSKQFEIILT